MAAFRMEADAALQDSMCRHSSGTIEIKAREFLFRQGEDARGCYLVRRGVLSLFMEAPSGKKILGREVGVGCIVGLPATINGNPLSLTCRVVEDAELAFLSREDLMQLMSHDVGAAMQILDLLSSEVQSTRRQVAKYARPARPKPAQNP